MVRKVVAVNERGQRVGEDHQKSRLTNEQVDRVRDLHELHDLSYGQLSKMFGVSKNCIADICKYRRRVATPFGWKTLHIEEDEYEYEDDTETTEQ